MGETEAAFREGDIFDWRWADQARDGYSGPFGSYHCYSRRAVVKDGRLVDTYWPARPTDKSFLEPSTVTLTLIGNINELTTIPASEKPYFRDGDVIDMRHSNHQSAPVYIRAGVKRNPDAIRAEIARRRADAKRDIGTATWRLEQLAVADHQLSAGRLDEIYL